MTADLRALAAEVLDDPELPLRAEARRGVCHDGEAVAFFVAGAVIGTMARRGMTLEPDLKEQALIAVRAELAARAAGAER